MILFHQERTSTICPDKKHVGLLSSAKSCRRNCYWFMSLSLTWFVLVTAFAIISTPAKNSQNVIIDNFWDNQLTIFIHIHLKAFLQSTRSALISVCLVNGTWSAIAILADVGSIPSDASFEEATASVTGVDTVVLAWATISAYFTRNVQYTTCRWRRNRD